MAEPPPGLYTVGYPRGRDLELSLQDSYLLACNERFIHYRIPSDAVGSGSPVFEGDNWEVVGLHHATGDNIRRLDGKGTYYANEGIAISALRKETMGSHLA